MSVRSETGGWTRLVAITSVAVVGCESVETSSETTSVTVQPLTSVAAQVLGFEAVSDWSTTAGSLASASRHVEGTAALSLQSPASYTTLTSRALASIGSGVTNTIGFDLQVPEVQPNPSVVGSVQLTISIPSRGVNNSVVGVKDLANMPRGIFRRIEFPLSASLQSALNGSYSDLRFSISLNAPAGATPYFFDRLSFTHANSEPVSNARNAPIMGFETATAWSPTGATTSLVDRRTEKLHALSVMPTGYTTLTSDRLATPAGADATVGFDLHLPAVQPNPNNYGEVKLFIDLPSQGIYSLYLGRNDLLPLPRDTFARVSFTLPPNVANKLTQEFDDLRFRIELNTPPSAGPYLLDRFRFGATTAPTESISVSIPTPANVSAEKLLFLAKDQLNIGADVKIPALQGTRMVAASLGGVSIGARAEIDSILAAGRVDVAANAKVRGYIAGTSDIHADGLAQVFGESGGAAGPTTVASWTTTFEPSTLDVVVNAGNRLTLTAGRYRTVTVGNGGSAVLTPGTYRFDNLRVSTGGSVEFNSNQGSLTVFVRSELGVDGRLKDAGLVDLSPSETNRRANLSTWLYSGTQNVRVPLDWAGLLVAPGASVTPNWGALVDPQLPPNLGGLWAGTITIPNPPATRSGTVRVLAPPYKDPFRNGAPILPGSPTDVQVAEQSDQTDGSFASNPVLVEEDNPAFYGTFDWRESHEAGSGSPPYFSSGSWTGIAMAHLSLRHSPSDDIGFSAMLLPGAPNQKATTDDVAKFQTRTFGLFHGRTFRVNRAFFHTSDATPVGFGTDATSLYVQLDPQILLVPVFIGVWDSPDQAPKARAQIDYIGTQQFSASATNLGDEPTPGVGGDPGRAVLSGSAATPPDEIWSQCGIQIQAIAWLYLGQPTFHTGACASNIPGGQDYALDYADLEQHMRSAVNDAYWFDLVFGPSITALSSGIHPIIMQYGANIPGGTCSNYAGKADSGIGAVQINDDRGYTTAHELGHVLLHTNDHFDSDTNNLMHNGATGRELTAEQCLTARENAARYSARMRDFYVAIGFADPVPPPVVKPVPVGPSFTFEPLYTQICCQHSDGKKSRAMAALCLFTGGKPASNCSVCCQSKRTCPSDACCTHSTTEYHTVDVADCEPEDVAPTEACSCCDFGNTDACKKPNLPPQTCTSQGGQECITDPR